MVRVSGYNLDVDYLFVLVFSVVRDEENGVYPLWHICADTLSQYASFSGSDKGLISTFTPFKDGINFVHVDDGGVDCDAGKELFVGVSSVVDGGVAGQ